MVASTAFQNFSASIATPELFSTISELLGVPARFYCLIATNIMAPLTPDQSRDAFRHILRDVLGCDTTTSLYKALIDNGYDLNIASLQGISDEEIQGLSYPTSRTNDERRTILTSEDLEGLPYLEAC